MSWFPGKGKFPGKPFSDKNLQSFIPNDCISSLLKNPDGVCNFQPKFDLL